MEKNRETREHYEVFIVHKSRISIIYGHYRNYRGGVAKELLWTSPLDAPPEVAEGVLKAYNAILKTHGPFDLRKHKSA